jgi:Protein of unknown function (DUF5818)
MRNRLLLFVLLLGSCWTMAQTYPSQSPSTGSSTSTTQSGSQTSSHSVVGCLSGSDGNYTLSTKDGKSYNLTGDTSILAEHIGHTVRVTGVVSSSATVTQSGQKVNANNQSGQSIQVSGVKHLSKTCDLGNAGNAMGK